MSKETEKQSAQMMPGNRMGSPMGGGSSGEKAKDFKGTWGKLISYCKPYIGVIFVALLLGAAGAVITIIGPGKISDITDFITEGLMHGIDLTAVGKTALALAVLYGLGVLFSACQGWIMATVTGKLSMSLRHDISAKINKIPLSYFDKTSYGNVLSRITNDVDTIGQSMNQSIGALVSAITLLIGCLIMMTITNIIMTLTAVFATVIGFVLMMVIMKYSQKYFIKQQQGLGAINGHIEEIYSGHDVVKVYNAENKSREHFENINSQLEESAWKSQFFSGLMMPIMSFIGNFGYVAVCVVGAALAINGSISFGVIVAFMLYVRLFTQPLSQISQAANNLQSTAAAGERVFEFLSESELSNEDDKKLTLNYIEGNIDFNNVQFGYNDDRMVISDFSAHVNAGQKIAIVGPTGAGKTTMVNLLMRFYELQSGCIKIDNIPIDQITRGNVHNLFCMVLQDTWLFEGTIHDNLVYNKAGLSDGDIETACKAAGVHNFIMTLPEKYNTILNEEANLSAGQKQLITIARAMLQNAPMLILDEATSSVDTRTEVLIQDAMDKLMIGRTSIVIAHRLSTIKNADLILVMKDGDIIESGNHVELLDKNGFYADLYNSQFEKVS